MFMTGLEWALWWDDPTILIIWLLANHSTFPRFLTSHLKKSNEIIFKVSSITNIQKFYYPICNPRDFIVSSRELRLESRVLGLVDSGQGGRDDNLEWVFIQDLMCSSPFCWWQGLGCKRQNDKARGSNHDFFFKWLYFYCSGVNV